MLVVGASYEGSNARTVNGDQMNELAAQSGAVYVFARGATGWTQQAYIKAFNTDSGDYFGESVALFGDLLAVGAHAEDGSATDVHSVPPGVDDNDVMDSGAIYVFERSDATWAPTAYVKAQTPATSAYFGMNIALWGDTLVGGAYAEDSATGAAYVFQ
jgi:FG-GAP repeat protein